VQPLVLSEQLGLLQAIGLWVAALLTLAVLSQVLGDHPVSRAAQYLFVGLTAGYACSLALKQVLWPRLLRLIQDPVSYWPYAVFFALGLLLLCRGIQRLSPAGDLPLAVLFGSGAGLVLAGITSGTLLPQIEASLRSIAPQDYGGGAWGWAKALDTLFLILGTVCVLAAFQHTAKGRRPVSRVWAGVVRILGSGGRLLISIAFGALLAGALITFFSALLGRVDFLLHEWLGLSGRGF